MKTWERKDIQRRKEKEEEKEKGKGRRENRGD